MLISNFLSLFFSLCLVNELFLSRGETEQEMIDGAKIIAISSIGLLIVNLIAVFWPF